MFNFYSILVLVIRIGLFALPTVIVSVFVLQEQKYELAIIFGVSQLGTSILRFGLDAPLQRVVFLKSIFEESALIKRIFILIKFQKMPFCIFCCLFTLVSIFLFVEIIDSTWVVASMVSSLFNSFSHSIAMLFLGLRKKLSFLICCGSSYYLGILFLFLFGVEDPIFLFPISAFTNLLITLSLFYLEGRYMTSTRSLEQDCCHARDERILFAGLNAALVGVVGWGSGWYFSMLSSVEEGAVALAGLKIAQLCSLPMLLVQQMFSPEFRSKLNSGQRLGDWLNKMRLLCLVASVTLFAVITFFSFALRFFDMKLPVIYLALVFVLGSGTVFSQTFLSFVGHHGQILLASIISVAFFVVVSYVCALLNFNLIYSLVGYFSVGFVLHFWFAQVFFRRLFHPDL